MRCAARRCRINGRTGRALSHGDPMAKVIFLDGEIQPSVVCSPLQVCDIELQPGEIVRDVLVGDTVRWKVEPATSGAPGVQAMHLIVKPAEAGLVTSMVVTTSRRTYHIQLSRITASIWPGSASTIPRISTRALPRSMRIEASVVPGAGVPADQLNFAFHMSRLRSLAANTDL